MTEEWWYAGNCMHFDDVKALTLDIFAPIAGSSTRALYLGSSLFTISQRLNYIIICCDIENISRVILVV